jgi:hypothetical protein
MNAPTIAKRVALAVGWLLLGAGCATSAPTLTVSDTQPTHDGLYPIDNISIDAAWARPDFDLSPYRRIMLDAAGIQYRPASRSAHSDQGDQAFPLSEAQKARLGRELRHAFETELAKSERFELTDAPAPDVLMIRGSLYDVVSHVPPETAGRSAIYLRSVGEATLVIELVDSISNTVLVRAIDRRAAERHGQPTPSNSVSNWREVRVLAQYWARSLRTGLYALSDRLTLE